MPVTIQIIADDDASPVIKNITVQMEQLGEATKKSSTSFLAAFKKMKGRVAIALAAISIAIFKVTKQSVIMNKGLAEIGTLMGGLTKGEMRAMSVEMLQLAKASGQAIEPLLKARYDIVSAGFSSASESAQVLAASVKLATGGVATAAETADILTSALNSYSMSADQATMVSDILFTTVRLGKTTISELSQNLGRVLPIAESAGASLESVGAAMATITAGGIDTASASTALRQAFVSLVSPSADIASQMNLWNIEIIRGNDGLLDIEQTIRRFQGLTLPEVMQVIPNIVAASAILSLASKYELLSKNVAEFGDVAGETAQAVKTMESTFDIGFKRMKESVNELMTVLGDKFLPLLAPIGLGIGIIVGKLAEWIGNTKGLKKAQEELNKALAIKDLKALDTQATLLKLEYFRLKEKVDGAKEKFEGVSRSTRGAAAAAFGLSLAYLGNIRKLKSLEEQIAVVVKAHNDLLRSMKKVGKEIEGLTGAQRTELFRKQMEALGKSLNLVVTADRTVQWLRNLKIAFQESLEVPLELMTLRVVQIKRLQRAIKELQEQLVVPRLKEELQRLREELKELLGDGGTDTGFDFGRDFASAFTSALQSAAMMGALDPVFAAWGLKGQSFISIFIRQFIAALTGSLIGSLVGSFGGGGLLGILFPSSIGGGTFGGGAVTNVGSQSIVLNVSAQNFDESFVRLNLIPILEREAFNGFTR